VEKVGNLTDLKIIQGRQPPLIIDENRESKKKGGDVKKHHPNSFKGGKFLFDIFFYCQGNCW
jgi:hypothetical protein